METSRWPLCNRLDRGGFISISKPGRQRAQEMGATDAIDVMACDRNPNDASNLPLDC
jgi:hypothetical protein